MFDALSAMLGYTALYYFRKTVIESRKFGVELDFTFDERYFIGLTITTLFWISLYWITGFYNDIYRRSRLREIIQTFNTALFGSVVIFFALILDDWVNNYKDYYQSFLIYFSVIFAITALFRFIISSRTNHRIQRKEIWFNTLMIGSNEKATALYHEFESQRKSTGNKFVGFVSVFQKIEFLVEKELPLLGVYSDLPKIIEDHQIEEVIIAIESKEHEKLEEVINLLEDSEVKVKMIPDMYDIISGQVRLESLGAPLIEIKHELMPQWQRVVKRVFDVVASAVLLMLLSPLMLFCMIMVKRSSPGPIFYRQKRMGLQGKEFSIIKFRSMRQDAESTGPQLSSEEDDRITKWGKVMRKYRLDELPQFINVILGEMSFVGPRPERQFYIDQISKKAPHCKHIHKVKPGITSWGMVKFGYAENVDEMIERLRYDIIYIENMNLLNDIKIVFYTILIVLQGRGK
jgi:exopolysaccharide biosynthesis polyprenyl glycosylphosphotransferase